MLVMRGYALCKRLAIGIPLMYQCTDLANKVFPNVNDVSRGCQEFPEFFTKSLRSTGDQRFEWITQNFSR